MTVLCLNGCKIAGVDGFANNSIAVDDLETKDADKDQISEKSLSNNSNTDFSAAYSQENDENVNTDTIASKLDNTTETATDTLFKDKLIVGIDSTFPPFEFLENGEPVGFDIDIISEIVKRLNRELIIRPIKWDLEFKELIEGEVDAVISAIPYNEDKESIVDFSVPYFNMSFLFISFAGSGIKFMENLAGKNIGILEINRDCLDKNYLKNFNLIYFKDIIEMIDSIKNKEIDAMILNLPLSVNLIKENKDMFIVIDEVDSVKNFVIVFKKNSSLKQQVDKILNEMINDGTYSDIYSKWFTYN